MHYFFLRHTPATLILIFVLGCGAGKKQGEAAHGYREVAIARLSAPIEYHFNAAQTHVLCLSAGKKGKAPAFPQEPLHFVVCEVASGGVLLEDRMDLGKVFWLDDSRLRVDKQPGAVDEGGQPQSFGYTFDIKTGTRVP